MDPNLMHPKIVHLPMALSVLMPLIAGLVAAAWWKGWLHRRAWLLVCLLQGIFVVTGFMSLASGEEDEERVERVVDHDIIHEHEEAAEGFFFASIGVLAVSVVAAAAPAGPVAAGAAGLTVVGSLVVLFLGIQVGSLGGGLVYEHGAATAFMKKEAAAAALTKSQSDHHHDDDDDDDDDHKDGHKDDD